MPARRLPLLLGSLALATACDLPQNLGDLGGSLLDPDAELIDAPGRRLAQGHYSRIELDGSLESGGWVVAKRHDLDQEAVSVVSFRGDAQCDVLGATDFQRVSSRIDVALPGLIAVRKAAVGDEPARVEFIDFHCEPRLPSVETSVLPAMPFPRSEPRGLLLLTEGGRLLLVDAANQRLDEVAQGIRAGTSEGDRLWLIEGELGIAVYDSDLRRVASWRGVSEFVVLSGWLEHDGAIRDGEGLHLVNVDSGERELLDPEGCHLVNLGAQVLAYYSPCEERHLRLSVPGHLVDRQEARVTIDIGPNVMAPSEILPFWQGKDSYVLYQVHPSDGASLTGDLHVAERLGDPDRSDADRLLAPNVRVTRAQIYANWNGTSGTLLAPRFKTRDGITTLEGLDPVAEGVAQLPGGDFLSERGTLVNFDGQVGDLVRVVRAAGTNPDPRFEIEPLASGVPIQLQAVDLETGAFGFVGDFGPTGGNAYLVAGKSPRVVGEGALPGTLRFLEQPHALAYLAHDGSGTTATLRAWLLEAGLNVRVSEDVSEYRELPWPSPGLLYAVPKGERAGLWFARAR